MRNKAAAIVGSVTVASTAATIIAGAPWYAAVLVACLGLFITSGVSG